MKRIFSLALTGMMLLATATEALAQPLYIYNKENSVRYRKDLSEIDHMSVDKESKTFSLFDKQGKRIYQVPTIGMTKASKQYTPDNDLLLDVSFLDDGTAIDLSKYNRTVEKEGSPSIAYNKTYKRNVATLNNVWGNRPSAFYKVNYADDNTFMNDLADGHTLECLVAANYDGVIADVQAKPFSSHGGGGTGFLITKKDNPNTGSRNVMSFIVDTKASDKDINYRWACSGTVPTSKVYYHLVAVYDNSAGKVRIYVDGERRSEVDAKGSFQQSGDKWFGIGCDANGDGNGESAWCGDVVLARIYSSVKTDNEVKTLFNAVKPAVPVADMLDVVFNSDGSATDISPMHMVVQKVGSPMVDYDETYKRNRATFDNPMNDGNPQNFYVVDYDTGWDTQGVFRDKLADGHTLECVFLGNGIEGLANDAEPKPFSSHEGGGTGLLVTKTTNGPNNKKVLAFLPHTTAGAGGNYYHWANSTIEPKNGKYYHVVGVWDKAAGKARVYVDGVKYTDVDASGSFNFPGAGAKWFGIGCDTRTYNNGYVGGNAWNGNVVIARIYDRPLQADEVTALYNQATNPTTTDMLTNVNFVSHGLDVHEGGKFLIDAQGFQAGDKIRISGMGNSNSAVVPMENTSFGWLFTIPMGFTPGNYSLTLQRGGQQQELGSAHFNIVPNTRTLWQGARAIAHRGDHSSGAPENSRASLREALKNNFYGSETDVYITDASDAKVIVNHNPYWPDETGQDGRYYWIPWAQYTTLTGHSKRLSNGETLPTLEDFLKIMRDEYKTSSTKLIIEIKDHSQDRPSSATEWDAARCLARGKACIDASVALVDQYGMQDRVEYISFNLDYCKYIHQVRPAAHVAYLNNDKWPQLLLEDTNNGVMGLDYTADTYRNNYYFQWVWEAHDRNMTTNVWTINDEATMREMATMKLDFITTDKPKTAQALYQKTNKHYKANSDLLLDVQFNGDNVTDASPYHRNVQKVGSVTNGYFNNNYNGDASNYCRIDYQSDQFFKAAMVDGHTMESIFCVTSYDGYNRANEAKWFSLHQFGGTGLFLSDNNGHSNVISLLPYTENAWRWTHSTVAPPVNTYYHVVGVYDKTAQKSRLFVRKMKTGNMADGYDGEAAKVEVNAPGSLKLAIAGSQWICIGADPDGDKANTSGKWHVKRARIYDRAMTEEEVNQLWGK